MKHTSLPWSQGHNRSLGAAKMEPHVLPLLERMVLAIEKISHDVDSICVSINDLNGNLLCWVKDARSKEGAFSSIEQHSPVEAALFSQHSGRQEPDDSPSGSTVTSNVCEGEAHKFVSVDIHEAPCYNSSSHSEKMVHIKTEARSEDEENYESINVYNTNKNPCEMSPSQFTQLQEYASPYQLCDTELGTPSHNTISYEDLTTELSGFPGKGNCLSESSSSFQRSCEYEEHSVTSPSWGENNRQIITGDTCQRSKDIERTHNAPSSLVKCEVKQVKSSGSEESGEEPMETENECERSVRPVEGREKEKLHLRGRGSSSSDSESKPFSCEVCGKSFTCGVHLMNHQRMHTGEKPYQCSLCLKTFTVKGSLDNHIREHSNEKPFSCPTCGRSFKRRYHLNRHMSFHRGEKPFKCSECDKAFSLKCNLNTHMRWHSGDKPYKCDMCPKAFSERKKRDAHIRVHTGERPFSCSECEVRFTQACALALHQRRFHGRGGPSSEDASASNAV